MDTTMTPEPLHVPDSLANTKRPKNKRRNKETKEPSKLSYHTPKSTLKETKQPKNRSKEKYPDYKPYPKIQRKENDASQEQITTEELRQAQRLPTASNKYLDAIKAELQDSDNK